MGTARLAGKTGRVGVLALNETTGEYWGWTYEVEAIPIDGPPGYANGMGQVTIGPGAVSELPLTLPET